jgi:5,10-methenyltetrahydrofolate synthetase
MPVVVIPAAPMIFRAWTPATPMTTDRHGIPVPVDIPADPTTGDAVIEPNIAPDILLLPLVAFDAAGYRLGYGGGYFDRTLAARVPRPRAIGVGFELARVPDIRPQAHDLPLDAIVTEAGVTRFQRSQ